MKIFKTIAFRLFLLIATVQAVVLVLLTYAVVRVQESGAMQQVELSAFRVSDMIRRAAQHSMMLNRKEDVHGIILGVGGEPGIEGIRIYNKTGDVVFSTDTADVGTTVDMNAEACVSCHHSHELTNPHPATSDLSRIFTKPSGDRVLGLITPIRNDAQCSTAGCHAHPASKTILGVLDVKMSLSQVDQGIAQSERQLLVLSVGAVLLVSLISGGFIWTVVRRPVKGLMKGMEMVTGGHLDSRLPATSNDELGRLANAFNVMTEELSRARAEITAWSQTLEVKVKEKTADLERAHKEMVKVEKMASLGNLASSAAHELNNPLEGILTFARLLMKRTARLSLPPEETRAYLDELKLVADEALRCGNIVKNLLVFARQRSVAFEHVPLGPIIERCALLMNHHAKMRGVELITRCTTLEPVGCDPNQIQQVLIALMVNAIEAMSATADRPEGGVLTVEARQDPGAERFQIVVADTGIGMTDDTKAHIFEPFFTTKQDGKGVGLGLAVAYGIIERHHGVIDVVTAPGAGTAFTISLPAHQPAAGENARVTVTPA